MCPVEVAFACPSVRWRGSLLWLFCGVCVCVFVCACVSLCVFVCVCVCVCVFWVRLWVLRGGVRQFVGGGSKYKVTAVGFEPTRLRTGALSQRLRPLGQTVLPSACVVGG